MSSINEELIKKIEFVNKYYSNYILHKLIEQRLDDIKEDIYKFEKFKRKLNQYVDKYSDNNLVYVAGEINATSKILNMIYSIISTDNEFKSKVNNLLKEPEIKGIIKCIYNEPDITLKDIYKKININANSVMILINKLIDADIVIKYGEDDNSYFELTSQMSEYCRNNIFFNN